MCLQLEHTNLLYLYYYHFNLLWIGLFYRVINLLQSELELETVFLGWVRVKEYSQYVNQRAFWIAQAPFASQFEPNRPNDSLPPNYHSAEWV